MKFSVMVEKTVFIPYFKTFDAESEAEAERMGESEMESLTLSQELSDLGWAEGDQSEDYQVRRDVTTAVKWS
jgi:hypothetical protein